MRTATLPTLISLLLVSHHGLAFDIYLNEDSDCPDDVISIVCEEQAVGDCCNGHPHTLYSSAEASDGKGGVVLYGLDQGQDPDSENRCGLQLAKDDICATSDIPQGSAAGIVGEEGGEKDPSADKEPTNGSEDGENDGGGSHGRRRNHPRIGFPFVEETMFQKAKNAKRTGAWRQTQHTAYAVRDGTHVWMLSRGSEHAPTYEALTDRQERIDFLKKHGVARLR